MTSGATQRQLRRESSQTRSAEYSSNPLADYLMLPELRGLWAMSSFNESGAAIDLSGQGRDLTNNGSAPRSVFNNRIPYVDLNGSSQYFSRSHEAGIGFTSTFTIGGWYRFDSASSENYLIAKWSGSLLRSWQMGTYLGVQTANLSVDGSASSVSLSNTVALANGTWYFMALRYVPSVECVLFTDTTKAITTTSIPASLYNNTTIALTVGTRADLVTYLNGQVTLVFACAAALSDGLLRYLYRRGAGFLGI